MRTEVRRGEAFVEATKALFSVDTPHAVPRAVVGKAESLHLVSLQLKSRLDEP